MKYVTNLDNETPLQRIVRESNLSFKDAQVFKDFVHDMGDSIEHTDYWRLGFLFNVWKVNRVWTT